MNKSLWFGLMLVWGVLLFGTCMAVLSMAAHDVEPTYIAMVAGVGVYFASMAAVFIGHLSEDE